MDMVVVPLAVMVALAVDRWWGEPRVRLHPVVWMGNYLGWAGRHVQAYTQQDPRGAKDLKAFWLGALAWIVGAALCSIRGLPLVAIRRGFDQRKLWLVSRQPGVDRLVPQAHAGLGHAPARSAGRGAGFERP